MKTMSDLLNGLSANGIERPLCIMGGEPLCNENLFLTSLIVKMVKENKPNTKIYLWTGYLYEDLKNKVLPQSRVEFILNNIDYLIDGPYIEAERDITLPMRGSRNQRIIDLSKKF
jgi:anaerobic ribonucleoside-triphosphate reductase activating protein